MRSDHKVSGLFIFEINNWMILFNIYQLMANSTVQTFFLLPCFGGQNFVGKTNGRAGGSRGLGSKINS
jgi:hypothetical protein